jgi:hypothetical protein
MHRQRQCDCARANWQDVGAQLLNISEIRVTQISEAGKTVRDNPDVGLCPAAIRAGPARDASLRLVSVPIFGVDARISNEEARAVARDALSKRLDPSAPAMPSRTNELRAVASALPRM